jgi:hypothetical protein
MYDIDRKWWNNETQFSFENENPHDSTNCDCMDCKLSKLEGYFHEITQQIREFLMDKDSVKDIFPTNIYDEIDQLRTSGLTSSERILQNEKINYFQNRKDEINPDENISKIIKRNK